MIIYRKNRVTVAWRSALLATIAAMMLGSPATAADSDSESHPMRFDRLSLDDGLSQSTVISILQDSRGLMWFGTENGLNSFNGYEFEQFMRERGNPDALSNDFVYDVAEDSDGNLWIATNGGGIARMDRKTQRFESFRHDAENPNSISDNVIRTLLIDAGSAPGVPVLIDLTPKNGFSLTTVLARTSSSRAQMTFTHCIWIRPMPCG